MIINRIVPKRFPAATVRLARRRMWAVGAASVLDDLRAPGFGLAELKRPRKGQHAVRVDAQYRVCFLWSEEGAEDVEVADAALKRDAMTDVAATLPPMHPGEMLREEFLLPLKLTAGKVAAAAGLDRQRIERLAKEEIGVTADTALRLGKVLGTSPEFWMSLQARYDLLMARGVAGPALDQVRSLRA